MPVAAPESSWASSQALSSEVAPMARIFSEADEFDRHDDRLPRPLRPVPMGDRVLQRRTEDAGEQLGVRSVLHGGIGDTPPPGVRCQHLGRNAGTRGMEHRD